MRILGIDTAIPKASVALIENGKLVEEVIHDPAGQFLIRNGGRPIGNHAEIILPLIQSIFDRARISVNDLAAIGLSIGPGSFTGLRIGLATVNGLAYGAELLLVGISTLRATAARIGDFDGVIGAMLDARKGEVYLALFRCRDSKLSRLTTDAVLSIPSAVKVLQRFHQEGETLLLGDGAKLHERQLAAAFGNSLRISDGIGYASTAALVALNAAGRLSAGSRVKSASLTPAYLRLPEAETKQNVLPQLVE